MIINEPFPESLTSAGHCAQNYYKYGQVISILSLLLTTSSLVLLLITVVDVGRSHEYDHNQDNHHNSTHVKVKTHLNF